MKSKEIHTKAIDPRGETIVYPDGSEYRVVGIAEDDPLVLKVKK